MARTSRRDQMKDDPVVGYNEIKSALDDALTEERANRLYRYTGAGVPQGPITTTREATGETREVVTTASPAFTALRNANLPKSVIQRMYNDGLLEGDAAAELYNQTNGVEPEARAAPAPTRGRERVILDEIPITADAPSAATPAAAAQGPRVLRRGDRSEETRNIQRYLQGLGYNLGEAGADGIFGSDTEKAVKQFQKDHGLAVDGKVGKNTYAALTKRTALAAPAGESSGFKVYLSEGVTPTTEDPRPGSISREIKTSPVRFNMNQFSDENIDKAVGDPIEPPKIASDRDAPTENTQAYLDFGLDEEPRRTAFPLYRGRRNRRNRK